MWGGGESSVHVSCEVKTSEFKLRRQWPKMSWGGGGGGVIVRLDTD